MSRQPVKLYFSVFSLLHAKVQKRPPVLWSFHFLPCTFNFLYDLDFCYKSFDLFQSGLSIEINYIFRFYFGPPFNFYIEFKYLNIFSTYVLIFFNFFIWLKLIIYFIFILALILLIFYFNPFIFFYISRIVYIFVYVYISVLLPLIFNFYYFLIYWGDNFFLNSS